MNRLKELRESKNLTVKEVALGIGITPERYRRIESGRVKLKIAIVVALAVFYNTSTDYIMNLTDDTVPHAKAEQNPRLK